ncbi:type I-F CRISPR-associated protein Cas7f/Csy3 [Vibrio parahaemolyticus]|uniref:type I-F CRISPR-associated protein Cas7f/Csy3 n=1 Tax=Vibrio parahaemolyticus TaxID=670 RepID=UPI002152B4AF|nr:type I-F CRISPR-associated protein Cas7f/Csy3 [Vibrio parahaemolyticus]
MKLPTNLAYERSIAPSDVCFFVVWPDNKKTPLTYTSRTVLGQMETASLAYDSSGNPKESALGILDKDLFDFVSSCFNLLTLHINYLDYNSPY